MARHSDGTQWLWIAGLGAVAYYLYQQSQANAGASAAGTPFYSTTPTPLSIYPEFAYTAQTSMATTPAQKASTAVITPINYFTSVQEQEQAALLTQCAGGYPGCTPMLGDTQLGL
jgi:hypothetical protein